MIIQIHSLGTFLDFRYSVTKEEFRKIGDYSINMKHRKLDVFAKCLVCPECGLIATYFKLFISPTKPYNYEYQLCGKRKNGQEVIFTLDHSHPTSLGGSNHISNLQTMCKPCNQKKGQQDRAYPKPTRASFKIVKMLELAEVYHTSINNIILTSAGFVYAGHRELLFKQRER